MPRLKQRRQNIQYGGTKVSVRDSLKTSFEAIIDEGQVALALLQHCESIEYMDIKSYGAVLFIVKLPESSSSLVMVESQTESNDNTKLKFIESTLLKDLNEAIQKEMPYANPIQSLKIKLVIKNSKATLARSKSFPVQAKSAFENLLSSLEDSPLKQRLMKLIKHHANTD